MLHFENAITYSNICLLLKIVHNAATPPLKNIVTKKTTQATQSTTPGERRLPKNKRPPSAIIIFSFHGRKTMEQSFKRTTNIYKVSALDVLTANVHTFVS